MCPGMGVVLVAEVNVVVCVTMFLEPKLVGLGSGRTLNADPRREGVRFQDFVRALQAVAADREPKACQIPPRRTVSTVIVSAAGNGPPSARRRQRGGTSSSKISSVSGPSRVARRRCSS